MTAPRTNGGSESLVDVFDLHKHYTLPKDSLFRPAPRVFALNGVSFSIKPGRSFGVVGESGCGKSTLARTVMGLEVPTGGRVLFRGQDINAISQEELRQLRCEIQQDLKCFQSRKSIVSFDLKTQAL